MPVPPRDRALVDVRPEEVQQYVEAVGEQEAQIQGAGEFELGWAPAMSRPTESWAR